MGFEIEWWQTQSHVFHKLWTCSPLACTVNCVCDICRCNKYYEGLLLTDTWQDIHQRFWMVKIRRAFSICFSGRIMGFDNDMSLSINLNVLFSI